MNISTTTETLSKTTSDLLIIRFFEEKPILEPKYKELDAALVGLLSKILKARDFRGKLGETLLLFTGGQIPSPRLLLLGMGKRKEYDLEKLRIAVAAVAAIVQKHKIQHLAFALTKTLSPKVSMGETAQAIIESLLLATYKFTEYKKLEEDEHPIPLQQLEFNLNFAADRPKVLNGASRGQILAGIVNFVRDLGNHPANVATPSHLAEHAEKIARTAKNIKARVLHRGEIKKEKMEALLAVAAGSDEEPKFIILEYRSKTSAPTVALVGKGITFDSGGISIKPGEKMEEMKYDMAGAATVMGVIRAASELKLPINLVGLIPATENLPSGKATKPGDIIRSRSGKTIEVVNTDAEGRLVLADALNYAKKYKPDLVIDFATLTGAILVALGDDLIGAFTNKPALLEKLKTAATETGEKIWPMPLVKDYEEFIKSDFADLRNIGTVRYADAINAANFLQHFVDYPWIHLDIAGVAWATREKPYRPKGATGTGVQLAIEFLKHFKK